jgi:tRNA-specific 2-thiouridylase
MKKFFLFFSLMFFAVSFTFAQRTVTGMVQDDSGVAIIGANVLVKGTTIGTITVPSKDATRALAAKHGLIIADKPDSQDICFVPDGNYAGVIEKLRPGVVEPGDIVDTNGTVLGQHNGVIHYTIGQRRGLGIGGLADPLYVVALDVDKKHVIVGPKELLKTRIVPVAEVNWLGDEPLTSRDEWHLSVKVRSTRPPREAILRPINEKRAEVELLNPEEGVSPGQACVFYDTHGSRIYGGGWITKRA